ncbi:MAG TPA: metal ABC transporter permease [Fimbriimonadaceae bacterium]|nr:metal ABC transporter permease [Fimbriimonadaceae bacterium]
MGPAVLAAVFMSPIHALFGLHIVRRGLIFIDLAVAQVAAFGMSLAIGQGYEAQSPTAYWYSVGFALAGALLISVTRFRLGRVPHEAIIGVVYVLATAASIIVLEFSPSGHGLEELKNMLAGNILFVTSDQLR